MQMTGPHLRGGRGLRVQPPPKMLEIFSHCEKYATMRHQSVYCSLRRYLLLLVAAQ